MSSIPLSSYKYCLGTCIMDRPSRKVLRFHFFQSILHKMDEFKKMSCGNVYSECGFHDKSRKKSINHIQKEQVSTSS